MQKPGPLIYLAGPITNVPNVYYNAGKDWRYAAELIAEKNDAMTFNPLRAFRCPAARFRDPDFINALQAVNDVAVRMSTVVLVALYAGVESKGTAHEMELCVELGKPVIVWQSGFKGLEPPTDTYVTRYHPDLKIAKHFQSLDLAVKQACRFVSILFHGTRA
jgi:hypothetical protein